MDGALFNNLPAEILQQIAEEYIPASLFLTDGRAPDDVAIRYLLQHCSFSAAFASTAIKVFFRRRTLVVPIRDILGLAQATHDGPLLLYNGFHRHNFWSNGPYIHGTPHRALAFPANQLRNLRLRTSVHEGGYNCHMSFFPDNIWNHLLKILPRIHEVFPALQALQIQLGFSSAHCNIMMETPPQAHLRRAENRTMGLAHDNLFRLTVAMNSLHKHIRKVEIAFNDTIIDASGPWDQVVERWRPTCLFFAMEYQISVPYLFLGWHELGAIGTRKQPYASHLFELDDGTIEEDKSDVLVRYVEQRFGQMFERR